MKPLIEQLYSRIPTWQFFPHCFTKKKPKFLQTAKKHRERQRKTSNKNSYPLASPIRGEKKKCYWTPRMSEYQYLIERNLWKRNFKQINKSSEKQELFFFKWIRLLQFWFVLYRILLRFGSHCLWDSCLWTRDRYHIFVVLCDLLWLVEDIMNISNMKVTKKNMPGINGIVAYGLVYVDKQWK